jgi:DNA-binding transcriptional LysR family regulator
MSRMADLDKLDIKTLRAFYLVAKYGNLRLAASRLNQTLPAVSSKLKRLEQALNIELFERLPNKLILNVAGERFLQELDDLFERAEQALARLTSHSGISGRLSISIGTDHNWFSVSKVGDFIKSQRDVQLSMQVYRSADAVRALVKGDLDVSIGIFSKLPRAIEHEVLVESTLSLVCPPKHPLLRRRPLSLADIAPHTLILPPRHAETRRMLDKAMLRCGLRPTNVIEAANCQTALTFVEKGVGVAISHSQCLSHLEAKHVRTVDLGRVQFSVAYRRGGARSPFDPVDPRPIDVLSGSALRCVPSGGAEPFA